MASRWERKVIREVRRIALGNRRGRRGERALPDRHAGAGAGRLHAQPLGAEHRGRRAARDHPGNRLQPADGLLLLVPDVHAIPTGVLSSCPAGYLNASQVASGTTAQGGGAIAIALREDVDANGNFSMPLAYSPTTPGQFRICGYTNDGATTTLAAASLTIAVTSSSAPAPGGIAKPDNVGRPRVTRTGRRLTCSRGDWANRLTRTGRRATSTAGWSTARYSGGRADADSA